MRALHVGVHPRSRWVPLVLAVTVTAGVSTGLLLSPEYEQAFDYVYAVLSPICFGIMCVNALLGRTPHPRLLVPLFLALVVLSIVTRPHVAELSALAIAAGVIAVLACLCDRKSTAIIGALICCASISVSLVIGLTLS